MSLGISQLLTIQTGHEIKPKVLHFRHKNARGWNFHGRIVYGKCFFYISKKSPSVLELLNEDDDVFLGFSCCANASFLKVVVVAAAFFAVSASCCSQNEELIWNLTDFCDLFQYLFFIICKLTFKFDYFWILCFIFVCSKKNIRISSMK